MANESGSGSGNVGWQYCTAFYGYNHDQEPTNWVRQWGTLMPITVEESDVATQKGTVMLFGTSSNEQTLMVYDEFFDDGQVVAYMRTNNSQNGTMNIAFRVSDESSGNADGYLVELRPSGNDIRLREVTNGTFSTLVDVAKTIDADVMYICRIEFIGSAIKVRVWEEGSAEPGTWDIDTTDSTHTTGRAGVGRQRGGGETYCDFFAIDSDPTTPDAPAAWTDETFNAWSDQWCVTLEGDARTGAGGSGDAGNLHEYTGTLYLDDFTGLHSVVQDDGGDLRLTKEDGTRIPIDVVDITVGSGSVDGYIRFKWTGEADLLANVTERAVLYAGNDAVEQPPADDEFGQYNTYKTTIHGVHDFLDDPTGGTLTDRTQYGNDGTISTDGSAWVAGDKVTGPIGSAYKFDRADSRYISFASGMFPTDDRSFTLRSKVNVQGNQGSFRDGYGAVGSGVLGPLYFQARNTNVFSFNATNTSDAGNTATDPTAFSLDTWYSATGVYDKEDAEVRLYRDVDEVASTAFSGTRESTSSLYYMGCSWFNGLRASHWDGPLANHWMIQEAATAAEVEAWDTNEDDPATFYTVTVGSCPASGSGDAGSGSGSGSIPGSGSGSGDVPGSGSGSGDVPGSGSGSGSIPGSGSGSGSIPGSGSGSGSIPGSGSGSGDVPGSGDFHGECYPTIARDTSFNRFVMWQPRTGAVLDVMGHEALATATPLQQGRYMAGSAGLRVAATDSLNLQLIRGTHVSHAKAMRDLGCDVRMASFGFVRHQMWLADGRLRVVDQRSQGNQFAGASIGLDNSLASAAICQVTNILECAAWNSTTAQQEAAGSGSGGGDYYLRTRKPQPFTGPEWEVSAGDRVTSGGTFYGSSAQLQFIFPIGTARLDAVGNWAGTIKQLSWQGVTLATTNKATGVSASIEMHERVWQIQVTVTEALEQPRITVAFAGQSQGVRNGVCLDCADPDAVADQVPDWAADVQPGTVFFSQRAGSEGIGSGWIGRQDQDDDGPIDGTRQAIYDFHDAFGVDPEFIALDEANLRVIVAGSDQALYYVAMDGSAAAQLWAGNGHEIVDIAVDSHIQRIFVATDNGPVTTGVLTRLELDGSNPTVINSGIAVLSGMDIDPRTQNIVYLDGFADENAYLSSYTESAYTPIRKLLLGGKLSGEFSCCTDAVTGRSWTIEGGDISSFTHSDETQNPVAWQVQTGLLTLFYSPWDDRIYAAGADGRMYSWPAGSQGATPRYEYGVESGETPANIQFYGVAVYQGTYDD